MSAYNYNINGETPSEGPPPYSYSTKEDAAAAKLVDDNLAERRMANGSSGIVVLERIDVLNAYASESFEMVKDKAAEITSFVNELQLPSTEAINVDSVNFVGLDYNARPQLGNVSIPNDWPVNTTKPLNFTSLPSFTVREFPALQVAQPTYTDPTAPTIDQVEEPGDMEALSPVTIPTLPSITLPTPPTFDEVVIPFAPNITLPEFTATVPIISIDDPAVFTWGEPVYNSDVWADLLLKVLNDLRNGGTGLDAEIEDELYQRHLDRTQDENEKLINQTMTFWAGRGFPLPPGMLAGAINEINQQISRNNLNASRDITISQADLAQKNTQFIMEMGFKLEGMLREFYVQETNRILEAAKISAENAIAIYDAKAKALSLDLDVLKTEAAIYESRVKGALTSVEIFKGQIEAAKVTSEVQKVLADIYNSQLAAVDTMMKLYISEMEGAKIATEIEMTKLQRYKILTEAYIARLDGQKNKLSLYESQLRGEAVKADLYRSQVLAFSAETDALSKELDANLKQLDFILRQNQEETERYKAELMAYETEVRAKASEIGAVVNGFQAETSAYQAESGAQEAYYRVKIEELRAQVMSAEFNMKKAVAEVEATVSGYEAILALQLKGTEGVMTVGAQLTASAMNAVNASASIGFSASSSRSSTSSESRSTDYSERHNYNE